MPPFHADIVKTISSDMVCTKKTSPEVDSLNGLFLALIATRLCFVHNQVNTRLLKPEFDCANLDATYDCGCGDEPIGSSTLTKFMMLLSDLWLPIHQDSSINIHWHLFSLSDLRSPLKPKF